MIQLTQPDGTLILINPENIQLICDLPPAECQKLGIESGSGIFFANNQQVACKETVAQIAERLA